jgi:hypothetical protein
MVAHSLCEFGGGEEERKELEAYRDIPALALMKNTTKYVSQFFYLNYFFTYAGNTCTCLLLNTIILICDEKCFAP